MSGNKLVSGNKFAGVPPHIEKLARTLQENGLATSTAGAISLALSISDEECSTASAPYGSEKIPPRHPERQRSSPAGIANLRPSECGPPVSHFNTERKPGRIENVPELVQRPVERPKPKSTPAVFLHNPEVSAASVREAVLRKPEQCEKPQEQFDILDDETAVREILEQDDHLIYGEPEVVEGKEPMPEEEPVIQPAEPAPVQKPAQQPAQNPFQQNGRGRGLTKEEMEMTDITHIFNFRNR